MAVDAEQIDQFCLYGILASLCAALATSVLSFGGVGAKTQSVIAAFSVLSALLWVVRLWVNEDLKLYLPPVAYCLGAFIGYAVFRYFEADVEYPARRELLRILSYGLLFFVALNNLQKQEHIHLITAVLVALGGLIAFYAAYQFAAKSYGVWNLVKQEHFIGRATGTYLVPNHYAGFAEMAFLMGLGYTLFSRANHVVRIVAGYATLMTLAGVVVSLSRGGWLATAAGTTLFFILAAVNRRSKTPLILAGVVFVAVGVVAWTQLDSMQDRFTRATQGGSTDAVGPRIALWKASKTMWDSSPLWGLGPGQFDAQFPQFRPVEIQWRPLAAHNDYLQSLVEWGIIGTGLLFAAFASSLYGVIRFWKYLGRTSNDMGSSTSNRLATTLGVLGALAAIFAHGLVDFNLQVPANAIIVMLLLAILNTYFRHGTNRYWKSNQPVLRVVVTLLVLGTSAFSLPQGIRQTSENLALRKAKDLLRQKQSRETKLAAAEAYKLALSKEPANAQTAYEIGEIYRLLSWEGKDSYREDAAVAIEWFQKGIDIDPTHRHCQLHMGLTLDWIGRTEEGETFIKRAVQLDPNSHWMMAHYGWHEYQKGDYRQAKKHFERSMEIQSWENRISHHYLNYINERLAEEQATP